MRTLSKTLGFAVTVAATFAACAAAATLALGSTTLSAGNAPVASCGVSSLTGTQSVNNSNNVTQVVVSNIPAACSGDTLSITLADQNHLPLGSSSVTLGSCGTTCSATFTSFGASVTAYLVYSYQFAVVGA